MWSGIASLLFPLFPRQAHFCPDILPGLPPARPDSWHVLTVAGTNESGAYEDHSTPRCMTHAQGSAAMVESLPQFLLDALSRLHP